jgi:hypothetical protein
MEVFVVERLAPDGGVDSVHLALRQTRSDSARRLAGARELRRRGLRLTGSRAARSPASLAALPGASIDLRESWLGSVRDDCREASRGHRPGRAHPIAE